MSKDKELVQLSANEAVKKLVDREVSPIEMVDSVIARIKETDDQVNAIPTLCENRAREQAKKMTDNPPDKNVPFWNLAGLPIAVKDVTEVKGVLTTYGSPLYKDYVPDFTDLSIKALEKNGAIVIGKSNTPEFAAGGNTFNEVFGSTKNPWNLDKSSGGSSGGSGAALAARQVHLATGSDLGGSLRMPASFCSVVGLRPSPGRVPHGPKDLPFQNLWASGPMARDTADLALMLDAMTGLDPMDPLSIATPENFRSYIENGPKPRKVAFSPDLGITPVDPKVAEIAEQAAKAFEKLGVEVVEDHPDLSNAREVFHIQRSFNFSAQFAPLIEKRRDEFKPEVIWNVEKGLKLSGEDLAWAEKERGNIYRKAAEFLNEYDLLLSPAVIVPPFDVEQRYVTEVAGQKFDNYVDWFTITFAITLTSLPALSLPCGFTKDQLPIGLQMIGKPRGEADLLASAYQLEQVLGIKDKVPKGF